jgi:uncharacterized protein (TIGR01244 family)
MASRATRAVSAAVVAALVIVAVVLAVRHFKRDPNAPKHLTADVAVSGQIATSGIAALKDDGYRTIVNMRTENETPGQPSYGEMQSAVQGAKLAYGYVPMKQGAMSKASVEALATSLRRLPKPTVLYSEPSSRAARAWALAEASTPGGLDANAIDTAVKSVGANDDDLRTEIAARIAARR